MEKDKSAVIVEEDMCLVDDNMEEGSDDDHSTNYHADQNDNHLVLLASDPDNLAKVSLAWISRTNWAIGEKHIILNLSMMS